MGGSNHGDECGEMQRGAGLMFKLKHEWNCLVGAVDTSNNTSDGEFWYVPR